MGKRVIEIREKTDEELQEELKNLRAELFNLRVQQTTGGLTNPHRIKMVRKDIARVLTILRERELKKS
ncbi:MAG TPA: 50S ribosomal protein L29 [Dictyoglomaceae bacterium]|nr:50S ribosomal protein L29 [Dictyoglomaceae bacterium]HOL38829.1 50S ribosomal protein L29 [Dictyoglomaceae bacterium]HOP94467.1 50S ribosomal protein L29 [Dictyoglomaceae bacterium]HPP15423.1 50S ribosomal protein L29 [Dictyoglomaceae bacterium]HPU43199.1 50S ribosomal protein L29 [Dictyoglomaceae bacterium]